jgi:hypothetical protein
MHLHYPHSPEVGVSRSVPEGREYKVLKTAPGSEQNLRTPVSEYFLVLSKKQLMNIGLCSVRRSMLNSLYSAAVIRSFEAVLFSHFQIAVTPA